MRFPHLSKHGHTSHLVPPKMMGLAVMAGEGDRMRAGEGRGKEEKEAAVECWARGGWK